MRLTREVPESFLFSTKSTAISDMDLFFFLFTAKYNRFPVLLITPKHIIVHTVDISTLPFTVSGLNRHYFSGFSSPQQKEKKRKGKKVTTKIKKNESNSKRPARKKTDKRLHKVAKDRGRDMMGGRSESKAATRWFLYNDSIPKAGKDATFFSSRHQTN